MKSIAFFNNKGGVGKTTLLCNLAGYLALHRQKKVCVIDVDPQCNATQYLFDDARVQRLYSNDSSFTVHSVIEPLSIGEGYSKKLGIIRSANFAVDVVPGDPRLALTEDLLARDWGDAKAGEVRGIRTNLVFSELLQRLTEYDFVLFDLSPSLGAINRAVLLSSDYFISPMTIDIFSLKAFENIAKWIDGWSGEWARGLDNVRDKSRIPDYNFGAAQFIGYVTQQYFAKRDASGERRAVQAFENIRAKIDGVIANSLAKGVLPEHPFEMGTVPNLFSLIPMSQNKHKPVFELVGRDGVVGAHFAKVKDSEKIFAKVADELLDRTDQ